MGKDPSISVVIPTLDAGRTLYALLAALRAQQTPPTEVLVVDSSSSDDTLDVARSVPGVRTMVVSRESFDHGGTRHDALLATSGDIVCFVNQDAIPLDRMLITNLVEPLVADKAAASYARQVPVPGLRRSTALVQQFTYPAESHVTLADGSDGHGITSSYLSDVCSAYRRADYLEVGGFERPIHTNEDMLMCSRLLKAGKGVAYVAEARVCHSNALSLREQFARDKAIGTFLATYGNELVGSGEMGLGMRLARHVCAALVRERKPAELVHFATYCLVRLAGNRLGRMAGHR